MKLKALATVFALLSTPSQAQQCTPLDATVRDLPAGAKWTLYTGVALTRARYYVEDMTGSVPEADRLMVVELTDGRLFMVFVNKYSVCLRISIVNRRQFESTILGDVA